MDKSDKNIFNLFGIFKSWIPKRSKSTNVSRDFWMPDNSCRVCYECDTQFTLFNRRHHCRICGRIFCAKCTANSVPLCSLDTTNSAWDEWDKVRVCNYCFRQWEQGLARVGNGAHGDAGQLPVAASTNSSKSIGAAYDSTITICTMSFGLCEEFSDNFSLSAYQSEYQSTMMDPYVDVHGLEGSGRLNISDASVEDSSINQFAMGANRVDDGNDDAYGVYQLDSNSSSAPQADGYYGPVEFSGFQSGYQSQNFVPDMDIGDTRSLSGSTFQGNDDVQDADELQQVGSKEDHDLGLGLGLGDECEAPSSLCAAEDINIESFDFEDNGLLWLPPEPENEEDEREAGLFDDDDDDDDGDAAGEWGQLRASSSFGSGQHRRADKCGEEHKRVMKSVVDGHFRALLSQLLQVENIPESDDDAQESWLEIITSLSWEAATLLKPDTSGSGGMDPAGYVKVKCLASGHRTDSMVLKGIVCKKNVAHRRMATRIEKPRVMILGGALEYQRVSNHLSSFDTLLQQERDHLKMAVAKIDAHHPNVLLVEKSVSRCAQEYILAKDISLVLNIKRPLLERIARCTGAQIVPSIDHLSAQKMGHCEVFHVDKCFEDHGSAGQSGKKLTKTLMYFEGCPKPLGCTILLRGADGDELKKVKHVVQYGVFAAYHLALETSFLADERAALPEVPFTVAFPNKSFSIDRSISLVPGFTVPSQSKMQNFGDPNAENAMDGTIASVQETELIKSLSMPAIPVIQDVGSSISSHFIGNPLSGDFVSGVGYDKVSSTATTEKEVSGSATPLDYHPEADGCVQPHATEYESVSVCEDACNVKNATVAESISWQEDAKSIQDEVAPPSKEEFPPSPSDEQSILVSLSSRCVWKGTVCERSHLFRIKYYGSFDKPLGRFLQDKLFDQKYECTSCKMPAEAHVHCYTHRQGTLTISVKKLQIILPGEQEGKIWMWHRCLRCPRIGGIPPATLRVLMSDAAWGLSFGKFLELSFSNHAAASRVASCGHSLHRDCLRFYGSGSMVACFRYASIDVFSVYLPPPKLEFNYDIQDWIQTEAAEVVDRAEFLFSEVLNGISQIAQKRYGDGNDGVMSHESRNHIAELKGVLQNERTEFEEMHRKILHGEGKKGHPAIDILEINRLRRQLLFQSYMWDHRLVYAASLDDDSSPAECVSTSDEKPIVAGDVTEPNAITRSSNVANANSGESPQEDPSLNTSHDVVGKIENVMKPQEMTCQTKEPDSNLNCEREDQSCLSKVSEGPIPLECGSNVRRTLSDSEFVNLSDTLDARWTGKVHSGAGVSKDNNYRLMNSISVDSTLASVAEKLAQEHPIEEKNVVKIPPLPPSPSPAKPSDTAEDTKSWLGMPFLNFYRSFNKNFLASSPKLDTFGGYNPMYVSSVRELGLQGGAKWLLPVGFNETVIPVYDDEPTSIISYALLSQDYYSQLSEAERAKETIESSFSLPLQESASFHQFLSLDESILESCRSLSIDESMLSTSGPRNYSITDPLLRAKSSHIRVSFTDNGPLDKVKYTVTCYYAKHFDALRKMCCSSELDFVRSLSRCKKWGAQGGKSNVFFAKTLDDRFIIKQVTKTELESFIKFGPEYFKYLTESISSKSPTCLAKILGIFQVATKNLKGGKESKIDVLVMENLLFRRNVTRLYDLKGSSRSRYNADTTGSNKVLLDQNLIEAMPTSPIFVGNKAKRLLERAVWNDTSLLASIDVMDYSLLVGVDEEKHELVVGIIDFMRQYTWDKHLETWVKASGILGGPKNVSPTVISPDQYKKRFRKAMTAYFLMVPDQWSPPTLIPSRSQTNLFEDNAHLESSL